MVKRLQFICPSYRVSDGAFKKGMDLYRGRQSGKNGKSGRGGYGVGLINFTGKRNRVEDGRGAFFP